MHNRERELENISAIGGKTMKHEWERAGFGSQDDYRKAGDFSVIARLMFLVGAIVIIALFLA